MPESILDCLSHWRRKDPDRTACAFYGLGGAPSETLTYGELEERTDELAWSLKQLGIGHGEPVPLVYRPGIGFLVAFLATAKIGALAIPLPPPGGGKKRPAHDRLALVAASSGASMGLTEAALLGQLSEGREAAVGWIATDRLERHGRRLPANDVNPILFLQYTSGSTSAPRGVMVSHANVVENSRQILRERETAVSWLPHFHDMGLIGSRLFVLITGGTLHAFSPADFLRRPALWFELMTRTRANVTASPNFGFDYCLRPGRVPEAALEAYDLSSLRMVMNGSEPVRTTTMDAFVGKYARAGLSPDAVFAAYGLAEYTLCVATNGRRRLTASARALQIERRIECVAEGSPQAIGIASCGRPLDGVDLRIVDPASRIAVPEGHLGEIWVDGSSKTGGYWRSPEQTAERFEARLADADGAAGPTYLRTGDIGTIFDGELYVCGRMTDMIVVAGANYFPNDVEAAVEAILSESGMRAAAVALITRHVADDEAFTVLIEAGTRIDLPELRRLRVRLRAVCQAPIAGIATVAHGSISRTSSGKIARTRTAAAWEAGEIPALEWLRPEAEKDPADPLAAIAALVDRLSPNGGDEGTLGDLGLDSIELVDLSLNLERLLDGAALASAANVEGILDLRVLQTVRVGQIREVIADVAAGGLTAVAGLISRLRAEIDRDEAGRMRRDAQLGEEQRPRRAAPLPDKPRRLLTGATGFLGSFLLDALLRLTDDEIVVVARARDGTGAADRVHDTLRQAADLSPRRQDEAKRRIKVVEGDISLPRFGLSGAAWQELAATVTSIYHSAADVDYVRTYRSLAGSNVEGTREIIALASTGVPKNLEYVSTTFIYGWQAIGRLFESDSNRGMEKLDFGYAQTKWVAEQLVHQAIARGVRARVFRPAFVTASRTARYARGDVLARVLGYAIRHRMTTNANNQLSMLPVDVCASNIVALSLGGDADGKIYNVTASQRATLADICRIAARRFGYTFEYLSFRAAVAHVARYCTPEDELYPLRPFIILHSDELERMADKTYDNTAYAAACAAAPLAEPEPALEDTVSAIVRFLLAEELIPPVEENEREFLPASVD